MKRRLGAVAALFFLAGAAWAGDRDTAMALVSGAEGLIKLGHYDKAEDMCQRAVQADEGCAEAYCQLALCQAKLGRPREAMRSYQKAEALATAAKDELLARKARQDAEKLCPGLLLLTKADSKLHQKVLPMAQEALDAGYLETARDLFEMAVGVAPDDAKAKEGLREARRLLEERGDPVQAKLADAMLQEVWYMWGVGKKPEATTMATELSSRYASTSAGKEARELVRNNFGPPRKEETVALAKKIKARAKPQVVATSTPPTTSGKTTPSTTTTPTVRPPTPGAAPSRRAFVDLDALEATATAEAGKLPKDGLVAAFNDAYKLGKDWYAKAAPGTEGNQANLARAVEQFVRCEAIYQRLDAEKMMDEELDRLIREASMLKYGCLKMVVLSQQ